MHAALKPRRYQSSGGFTGRLVSKGCLCSPFCRLASQSVQHNRHLRSVQTLIAVSVIVRFGEDLELLHGFGEAFTEEAGAKIVKGFTFSQQRTNTAHTLESVVSVLEVK